MHPRDDNDATLQSKVLAEQLALVYYIVGTTLKGRLIFIGVIGAFMHYTLHSPWVLPLVLGHVVLYLWLLSWRRWQRSEPLARGPYWARHATRAAVLLGLADALVPWVFVPVGNLPVTCVLAAVMMGNCARAVQSLRPLRGATLAHVLPPMLSLIAALLWKGGLLDVLLACFIAIYVFMTLRVGAQEHRQLLEALALRFENEALARRLAEQVAATEQASAEKTRFLAAASHDLRQPLHAIALFGSALEHELEGGAQAEPAQGLMRAVRALGQSLDSLLDIARLDAGSVKPHWQPVSVDALLMTLQHTFAPRAQASGLQLRLRASGLWVRSDPQLLQRLVSNLLDNALKYTHQGGVLVTARLRGKRVCIEVRDSGIGIAPELRSRVFEEFYQANNPGRDRSRGLGIGLSIVRRLARELSHELQLDSWPGLGTRVRVHAPRTPAPTSVPAPAPTPAPASPSAPALPRRVLLLDDEADIRLAMLAWMRQAGIDATAAANEDEAQRALAQGLREERPYELLISDLRLADGEDGLDASQRLRAQYTGLALLLITGEIGPALLAPVRACGIPLLFKPVSSDSLYQALRLDKND
ncbi:hybrid sensor histidine kinase/response regulator [Variovorax sp. LARHSF232]